MAYSLQLYTGDGVQTTFSFSFPYLDRDHVEVKVDGSSALFTFLSDNLISISPAPAVDAVVEISRVTPKERLVDYLNGSIQDAEDFDLDSNQLLYLVLEGLDEFTKSLSRVPVERDNAMYQDIDMNDYKITGLAEPTEDTDAVRLVDIQGIVAGAGISQAELDAAIAGVQAYADTVAASEGAGAVIEANLYTDSQKALSDAYADSVSSQALSDANVYTDGQIATLTTYVDTQDSATLVSANAYTDAQIAAIPASSGPEIGDVMETYRTPNGSWLALDNSAVDSTTYSSLKAITGFDKVGSVTSSYDPTGRTGFPSNALTSGRSASYNLVMANGVMYYEGSVNAWSPSSQPSNFYNDYTLDFIAVDGNNVAGRGLTTGEVLVSSDGGATFTSTSTGAVSPLQYVNYINGVLIAIDGATTPVVFASIDNGTTWESINSLVTNGATADSIFKTEFGFGFYKSGAAYMYNVDVVGGTDVAISQRDKITLSVPTVANYTQVSYNIERKQIIAVHDESDTQNILACSIYDTTSRVSFEYYIEIDTTLFSTSVFSFEWISGNTYVLTHSAGITFFDIDTSVGFVLASENFSSYVDGATHSSLGVNRDEGIVTIANASGGVSYYDVFNINIDTTLFYLPHNVSKNKYIKAL